MRFDNLILDLFIAALRFLPTLMDYPAAFGCRGSCNLEEVLLLGVS